MNKTVLFWSSGKDSAFALHRCRQEGLADIVGLITTVNRPPGKVAVHGISETLLDTQAKACGLTLVKIPIPAVCSNSQYEDAVLPALEEARSAGVTQVAFGDLYLEDIRDYRTTLMRKVAMNALFPLWRADTHRLARAMLATGLRAVLSCVDTQRMDASFAGRMFDETLLEELPPKLDPCGENGEFHTFVFAGPMFTRALSVRARPEPQQGRFAYAAVSLDQIEADGNE